MDSWYQESISSKIFKKITNNPSFSKSHQQAKTIDIDKKEIKLSMTLPLHLRFYWNTLKYAQNSKDQVATKG